MGRTRRRIVVKILFLLVLLPFIHAPLCYGLSDGSDTSSSQDDSSFGVLTPTRTTRTLTITPTESLFTPTLTTTETVSPTYSPTISLTHTPSILISGTQTVRYSPTISPTLSLTPSLEEVPDNMYTRAESCGIQSINQCAERFCNCITKSPYRENSSLWHPGNGVYRCDEEANRNCYYIQYCVRERVSCIWNASFEYHKNPSRMEPYRYPLEIFGNTGDADNDGICHGMEHIYGNFSQLSSDVSYYDSLFYSECVDYVTYILKRTAGLLCIPKAVPMYSCGPSLFPVAPTRFSNYTSIPKGSRRLVISIRARIVGDYAAFFNESETIQGKASEYWLSELNSGMYKSFHNAIGVDGEFAMEYSDECITVHYNVGVGDADPWVGDLVTANALRLMLRNVSWMEKAQVVLDAAHRTSNLTVPIVVYGVGFEAGTGQLEQKLCDGSCVAGLTFAMVMALVVFSVSLMLCVRRPQPKYSMIDITYDSEEEMDSISERPPMKR
ncbi:uncharacterized protein TM35_000242580 [Trypanosoma theileri]|uniref:Uncharacterized protein n=1 Tax=Trypanosoma theileri TaxID=67003 RepID=A0A1X0NRD3_9TRYP|nr:uncharacterized protein TM35_000242580 [Trypanosoma theileri]ORC87108.1 hypothetical protein TM35_000242580 [Trypanosoma theileri]